MLIINDGDYRKDETSMHEIVYVRMTSEARTIEVIIHIRYKFSNVCKSKIDNASTKCIFFIGNDYIPKIQLPMYLPYL